MQLPIDIWYRAIENRHSNRTYNGQPVDKEKLERLEKVCAEFSKPGARAALTTEHIEEVFKGIVGSYGKVRGAPAYAAFIGELDNKNVQENVGYVGEGILLEATSLGLATCWIGASFHPESVSKSIRLHDNEKILAITPIGYPKERGSFEDVLIHAFAKSHKRKDLLELVSGLTPAKWPEWVRIALEAARLAPSAINRQPWRFLIEEGSITTSVDNLKKAYNISKRLDCGIAMLHLELGARRAGVNGDWEYLETPEVARFTIK